MRALLLIGFAAATLGCEPPPSAASPIQERQAKALERIADALERMADKDCR